MTIYSVQQGDTLSKLAKKFGTTVEELAKLNNIEDINSIFVGQSIIFNQDNCEEWHDLDGNGKVSFGDFQGCGGYGIFLDKVQPYIEKTWTKEIGREIHSLYQKYVSNTKEAVLQGVNINGQYLEYNANPNIYRNNLDRDLGTMTLRDSHASSRVEVNVAMGKDIEMRDRKAFEFFKKALGDNLNDTSQVVTKDNLHSLKTSRIESTDIFKALVSEDVNPGVFTEIQDGKYKDFVFKEKYSGKVQLPALEQTANGIKYFTVQKQDGTVLYFDENGTRVKSLQELEAKTPENKVPEIPQLNVATYTPIENNEFSKRENYNDAKLNIGNVYIDGKPVNIEGINSNYYANSLDQKLGTLSLNTDTINKLEVQIKAGDKLTNKYDLSPKDIFKKYISSNINNTTTIDGTQITTAKIEETQLYEKFLELNPQLNNFNSGTEATIQLPTIKIAENGEKYFIFVNEDNSCTYFDEKGNIINI